MRKIMFSFVLLAFLTCFASSLTLVSCQEKTKEKFEDARDAVGTEVEQKIDTLGQKIDTLGQKINNAADSVESKTGKALEKGADKLNQAAEKLKDASKK